MSLTKIGSIGINTGIQFAGVTTVSTLHVGSGVTLSSDGDVFATGISTFSEDIKVGSGITLSPDGDGFYTGVVTATTFSGALSGSGANITAINASNISSGTVPTARLGSGTASSSTFLRGDSSFQTITTDLVGDTSPQLGGNLDVNTKNIVFGDSGGASDDRLTFGAGTDLSIYHDGSHSYISEQGTGNLRILTSSVFTVNNAANDKNMILATDGGSVDLYYDGTKRFETTSTGVTITGGHTGTIIAGDFTLDNQSQAGRDVFFDQSADRFQFKDNLRASFGDDHDLMIYHDTNHSYIYDAGTGDLKIQTNGAKIQLGKDDGETCANFIPDGAVELYHNNIKKLQTNDTYGTILSNTTDSADYTNTLLLTRKNYETSGYGVIFQAKGGSASGQNGLNIRLGTGSGSYLDKFTFDNDGLKFNGDTGAGNALADYEEGTWTPIFSGWSNISYSGSRNAEYLKVGDLVYIRGFIGGSSTGSNSGNISIGGLPFTPNSGGYGRHAVSVQGSSFALGSGNAGVFGLIGEGSATMDIYGGNASGTGINIDVSKWNGAGIYFAGTYHVMGF